MLLKVGELAKSTGMTVRTLHHYDAIDLLKPSAHSDAGYRLYNRDDIARLHAIQALRQVGLPLNEIGNLLSGKQEPLPMIIQQQITLLEQQIEQASELCGRLQILQTNLVDGKEPDMKEWLAMLASMSAYGKYFTAAELKKIFESWRLTEARWKPLIADIRTAMQRGIDPKSLEIQPLARRWMELSVRWMKGDFELMKRWQSMYLQEPAAKGRMGVEVELIHYINQAVDLRLAALLKFFTQEELERFNFEVEDDWNALADDVRKFIRKKTSLKSKAVRDAVHRFARLLDLTVNHDPAMREKFTTAYGLDPVLQAGSFFDREMRDFMRSAWMAVNTPA